MIRQHDPAERRALDALHDGQPAAYLEHKQNQITVHDTEIAAVGALIEQWHRARCEHGPAGAVMITRDNHTRHQLNQAARQRLKHTGTLPQHGTQIGLTEYAVGDRVIARRNDRGRDVDNGTLGTIIDIDTQSQHLRLRTASGQLRALDYTYVARHVQHAYAVTAHGAQGATVTWAGVIGRPEDFTRQWAYTALSRARAQTTLHLIAQPTTATSDREQYAPAEPKRSPKETLNALQRAMTKTDLEPLAHEQTSLQEALSRPPPRTTRPAIAQLPYPRCGPYAAPGSMSHAPTLGPGALTRRGPRLSP